MNGTGTITIQIKWDRGRSEVNCEYFFPTSKVRLGKLLKVVDMDFDHRDQILTDITHYLITAVDKCRDDMTTIKRVFHGEYETQERLQHMIRDKKYPNGVPFRKGDVKLYKAELRNQKAVVNELMTRYKKAEKDLTALQNNLDYMQERYGGSFE